MLGFIHLALCIMSELGGNCLKIITFSCKVNKLIQSHLQSPELHIPPEGNSVI